MNATIKKLGYIPDAIMIHVPADFFNHKNKGGFGDNATDREEAFRRFYESMGTLPGLDDDACFYHFISSCPDEQVAEGIMYIYVCFRGRVQFKAILVKFMRNEPVDLPTYQHPEPRNWCVTTGPVVKPPHEILLKDVWKGAKQGFRYTKELF